MSYVHYRAQESTAELLAKHSHEVAGITRILSEAHQRLVDHLNQRREHPAEEPSHSFSTIVNLMAADELESAFWREGVIYTGLKRRVSPTQDSAFCIKIDACEEEYRKFYELYKEVMGILRSAKTPSQEEAACARLNVLYGRSVRSSTL